MTNTESMTRREAKAARKAERKAKAADSSALRWQSKRNLSGPRGPRGRGAGAWSIMPTPAIFRAPSTQVCGLWPMAGGASRPTIGVPVGQDIETGSTVCCDAFSWFKAGFCSSASMSVFGLNGLGKSSWTTRQIFGLADRNIASLVCGDIKGEYTETVQSLARYNERGELVRGQVMRYGEGQKCNVLDQGAMIHAAERIGGERGEQLRELAAQRAADMVGTLVQIVRRAPLQDFEQSLLSQMVRFLGHKHGQGRAPELRDLLHLSQNPTTEMLHSILAEDEREFFAETKRLNRSLRAVIDGPLGATFSGQATERLRMDAPAMSIDISAVAKQSEDILAAVMLASWGEAFASIEAANALADAGREPQRNFNSVMDEMWRPMRIEGAGLVDKLDSITRLQRNDGTGNIFITHSLKDMESMASKADVAKARGFAERSGIVVTAGLAKEDLRALSEIKKMSEVEINTVAGWSTPPGWRPRLVRDAETGVSRPAPPPGAGKMLIKLGERAGIQTQVKLTPTELRLHDTNRRWIQELDN